MSVAALPVDVTQGTSNLAIPSLGPTAVVWPRPQGFGVNPNPVSLVELSQVWGFRRDGWQRLAASFFGTTANDASWFVPVNFVHPAATLASGSPCALHFRFDGSAFEVLFAGRDVYATLIVDGNTYASARYISRTLTGGVEGLPLAADNTYVRFDFGTRAPRNVSLYCRSSLGPCAIAVGAGDTLQPWDRSSEVSMAGQSDSYGGVRSTHWADNGLFYRAAMRLGIAHLDIDAIGGTGYAPNNANADTRNAGNAFAARLPAMTRVAPDLFFTAGGINDNNSLAAPPLYASGAAARAGYDAAVTSYFAQLRAALPETVLAAVGPWQPNAAFYPDVARAKADTILAALQAQPGPWVFLDNLAGGWRNSAGAQSSGSGTGWQTGTGTVASPRGDGNGDLYVSADGTHPSEAGADYLGDTIAAQFMQAIAAL